MPPYKRRSAKPAGRPSQLEALHSKMTVPGPLAIVDRRHPMFTLTAKAASPGTDHPARLRAARQPSRSLPPPPQRPARAARGERLCTSSVPPHPGRPVTIRSGPVDVRSACPFRAWPIDPEGIQKVLGSLPRHGNRSPAPCLAVSQRSASSGSVAQTLVAPNAEQRTGVLTRGRSSGVRGPRAAAGGRSHDHD